MSNECIGSYTFIGCVCGLGGGGGAGGGGVVEMSSMWQERPPRRSWTNRWKRCCWYRACLSRDVTRWVPSPWMYTSYRYRPSALALRLYIVPHTSFSPSFVRRYISLALSTFFIARIPSLNSLCSIPFPTSIPCTRISNTSFHISSYRRITDVIRKN